MDVTMCDIRGCKRHARKYRYATGCSMDPSGNGYNTDYSYIDLCGQHREQFERKNPKWKLKNL